LLVRREIASCTRLNECNARAPFHFPLHRTHEGVRELRALCLGSAIVIVVLMWSEYLRQALGGGFGFWQYYLLGELGVWGGAGTTMLLLMAIGAWRLPLLLVDAVVILAVHSGVGHKEYRFIYPAIVPLTVLAGVGLAQMASWAGTG
jgi:hypothetical protein